ncbi:unnamed protein product [Phaedon cochleariae]|uniref:Transposase domain-containing protein n=1 Tax=Phaedon cochleariae TaxID=80249 RepID=A0A9N9X1T4_PHACE|nr:unnamed protein product [Phaedon cochleariae]
MAHLQKYYMRAKRQNKFSPYVNVGCSTSVMTVGSSGNKHIAPSVNLNLNNDVMSIVSSQNDIVSNNDDVMTGADSHQDNSLFNISNNSSVQGHDNDNIFNNSSMQGHEIQNGDGFDSAIDDDSILFSDDNHHSSKKEISTLSLSNWALKHNVTHSALNDLLDILKTKHPELPSDARTLLGTSKLVEVKSVEPGYYYHFGLRKCIERIIAQMPGFNEKVIKIDINVDGLPLSKSSSSQVYPILCSINKSVFVEMVGIFHGYEKPKDANIFLYDFIQETIELVNNGLFLNSNFYKIKINAFICDAPAKSFITYTKGHSGYASCTKCKIDGQYINNRICFPEVKNLSLRSDAEFRSKLQEDHHNGTPMIEEIPNFNMIDGFPLDYMHLICLGVVKKLLVTLWCCGKPSTKISFSSITVISNNLEKLKKHIPLEFNRKPRSLNEVRRWKATEFRQFLFYTGPLVLRGILAGDRYQNFLVLHVAATILANSKHFDKIDYASSLFEYFVETFNILYGTENISHNVHNLLHITTDVTNHGPLDDFSAFKFENFLQSILKSIRKSEKPLQQIIKRQSERNHQSTNSSIMKKFPICTHKDEHFEGPTLKMNISKQFKKIIFEHFTLRINEPDNCCFLDCGFVILIQNIVVIGRERKIIGNRFLSLTDFYETPCKSSELGIFLAKPDLGPLEIFDLRQISFKCVKLIYKNDFVIFPLLHTDISSLCDN